MKLSFTVDWDLGVLWPVNECALMRLQSILWFMVMNS